MSTAAPPTTPESTEPEKNTESNSPDNSGTGSKENKIEEKGGGHEKDELDKAFEHVMTHSKILTDILSKADNSLQENNDNLTTVECEIRTTIDDVRKLTDSCEDVYMAELSQVRSTLREKFDVVKHKVEDSVIKVGLFEYMLKKVKADKIHLDELENYTEKHICLCLDGLEEAVDDLEKAAVSVRFEMGLENTAANVVGQLIIEKTAIDAVAANHQPKPRFRLDGLRTKSDDELEQIGRVTSVMGLKDGGVLVAGGKAVRLYDYSLGRHKHVANIKRTVRGKEVGIFARDSSIGDSYRAFDSTVMRYRLMDMFSSKGKVTAMALTCIGVENNVAIKGGIVALFAYRNRVYIGGDGVISSYPVNSLVANRIQEDDLQKYEDTKFLDVDGKVSYRAPGVVHAIFANKNGEVIAATEDKLLMFGGAQADHGENTPTAIEEVQTIDFTALLTCLVPRNDWAPNPVAMCINSICKFDDDNILVFGSAWQVNYSNLSEQPKMRYTLPVDHDFETSTSSCGSEATLRSVASIASDEGATKTEDTASVKSASAAATPEKSGFGKYLAGVKASLDHSVAKEKAADKVPIVVDSEATPAPLLHLDSGVEGSRTSLFLKPGIALEKSRVWSVEINSRRKMLDPIPVDSSECFIVDSAVSGKDRNHVFVCFGDRKSGYEQLQLGLYHVVPISEKEGVSAEKEETNNEKVVAEEGKQEVPSVGK